MVNLVVALIVFLIDPDAAGVICSATPEPTFSDKLDGVIGALPLVIFQVRVHSVLFPSSLIVGLTVSVIFIGF
jgi:hypothetical protein